MGVPPMLLLVISARVFREAPPRTPYNRSILVELNQRKLEENFEGRYLEGPKLQIITHISISSSINTTPLARSLSLVDSFGVLLFSIVAWKRVRCNPAFNGQHIYG